MKIKAFSLAATAVILTAATLSAADRDVVTQIEVKGLHCASCAKKLCTALNAVPSVASSQADAETGIAIVTPAQVQRLPSPRAQWEAVEKAGYTPLRLAGPYGTFTSKPKF